MKLLFDGHNYQYAAEQMLFTLFPGERAVYTGEADSTLRLKLSVGAQYLTATATLHRNGTVYHGASRAPRRLLSGEDTQDRRVHQRILKTAFYRAGTAALGKAPPWGSMTGVRPVKIPTRAMEQGASARQADALLRNVYFVTPRRRQLAITCAQESLRAKALLKPDELSLYIGIPFCPTRCTYCSFVSADVKRALRLVEPFLAKLYEELYMAGETLRHLGLSVRTVYIGGGTPTTLSAGQLDRLLERIAAAIDFSHCTEYTVEAGRPDTITAEKLAVLRRHGVGRVSVNPQSMSDAVLAAMGRAHKGEDVLRAWALARQSGIPCVNMDLIAGLPADATEGFRHTIDQIMALAPENITIHTLARKKGSHLAAQAQQLPPDEALSDMLDYAWTVLAQAGYVPYYLYRQKNMSGSFENIGWSKPGFQSLYNLCMMEELHSVLALGGGGVTKLVDPVRGRIVRITNAKYPQEYVENTLTSGDKWARIRSFYADKGVDSHGLSATGHHPRPGT